ncbi:hypothetical protein ACHHYP_06499, partial [Achlya hypogyna]
MMSPMWRGQWSALPIALPRVHADAMEVTLTVSEGSLSTDTEASASTIVLRGSSSELARAVRGVAFHAPAAATGVAVIDLRCAVLEASKPSVTAIAPVVAEEAVVEHSVPFLAVCPAKPASPASPAKTPSPATSKLWVHTGGAGVDAAPLVGPVTVHSVATPMYDTTKTYTRSLASPAHSGGKIGNGLWVPSKSPKAASPSPTAAATVVNTVEVAPVAGSVISLHYPARSEVASMHDGTWTGLPVTLRHADATVVELSLVTATGSLQLSTKDAEVTFVDGANGVDSARLVLRGSVAALKAAAATIVFRAPSAASGVASIGVDVVVVKAAAKPVSATASTYTLHYPSSCKWRDLPLARPRGAAAVLEVTLVVSDGGLSVDGASPRKELQLRNAPAAIAKQLRDVVFVAPSGGSGVTTIEMDYAIVEPLPVTSESVDTVAAVQEAVVERS